jgi:hypothetical protein
VSDWRQNFGNTKEFYELLRSLNPHLPRGEDVVRGSLNVQCGIDEVPMVTLSIFITLPDMDKLDALREASDTEVVHEFLEHINDPKETPS